MHKVNSYSAILGAFLSILFLAALAALVLVQADPLTSVPSRDGGAFAYIGHVILEGKLPYINAWDSKPPGIFYLNAFALWLGRGTRWGIWLMEFGFLFAAAGIGYRLMIRLWGPGAAVFGTVFWMMGLDLVLSGGNFTEEYSLPFSFLALFLFWKGLEKPKDWGYDLGIGLALSLGFLLRPNNIGVQISIVLTWCILLLARKDLSLLLQKVARIGAAVLLVFAAVCAYFWAKGALSAMLQAGLLYNLSYTGGHANLWSGLKNGFVYFGPLAWIALAGYVLAVLHLVRSIRAHAVDWLSFVLCWIGRWKGCSVRCQAAGTGITISPGCR